LEFLIAAFKTIHFGILLLLLLTKYWLKWRLIKLLQGHFTKAVKIPIKYYRGLYNLRRVTSSPCEKFTEAFLITFTSEATAN